MGQKICTQNFQDLQIKKNSSTLQILVIKLHNKYKIQIQYNKYKIQVIINLINYILFKAKPKTI
jgi:hypothetical protein